MRRRSSPRAYHQAAFEEQKTLEGFDFAVNPRIKKRIIVADLAYIVNSQ